MLHARRIAPAGQKYKLDTDHSNLRRNRQSHRSRQRSRRIPLHIYQKRPIFRANHGKAIRVAGFRGRVDPEVLLALAAAQGCRCELSFAVLDTAFGKILAKIRQLHKIESTA
jgi:hypothetical protein